MKISIIIPVYNTKEYLSTCFNSIIAQLFTDWECILINDGSTDESGCICDIYVKQDARFKVFHTPNKGVSAARNFGIKESKGEYITFIDSDDYIDDDYILQLYNTTINSSSELVVCGVKLIHPTYTIINQPQKKVFEINKENADRFIELNKLFLLFGPCCKLYLRQIVIQNKISFPLNIHYGEDLIFNYSYINYVHKIAITNNSGYNYQIRINSLSTSFRTDKYESDVRQWTIIYNFFMKKNLVCDNCKEYLYSMLFGIIYDSIMEIYNDKKLSLTGKRFSRLKNILENIIHTHELKKYTKKNTCAKWLKNSILNKKYVKLHIILELKK